MKVSVTRSKADDNTFVFTAESDEVGEHPILDRLMKEALGESVGLQEATMPALITDVSIKENVVHISLAVSIVTQFKLPDERMDKFLQALGLTDAPKNISKLAGREVDATLRNMEVVDFSEIAK